MFDSHIHTAFSGDCDTPMENMVRAAIDKGLKVMTFTDHIDYLYMDNQSYEFDMAEYDGAISGMQKKYQTQIEILKGMEIGIKPEILDRCSALARDNAFDFIIASVHGCQGQDFFFGNYFDDKTPLRAMEIYLDELYEMISEYDRFQVLGHIDLPKRYNQAIAAMNPEPLLPKYEKIFRLIIERGQGIELNTSGYRQAVGRPFPDEQVLRLFRECGGRILTLGSDSHDVHTLGADFGRAAEMLSGLGFESICTFKDKEPRFHELKLILEA